MPPLFFKTKGENKAPAEQHAAMNWPRKYGMARLAGSGSGRAEAAAANSFPGFLSNNTERKPSREEAKENEGEES